MTDVAQAFVPGHVTGFFTIDRADEPTATGSRGAGVALAEGVTVTVRRAEERAIALNGERIEMGAVTRVLDALEATVQVRGVTDLPLGSGFGVSGAMALGAALGVNQLLERALSESELVTIAHGAEVQAGTGLGDVVAQARGGMPVRLEPGGPHENVMDGIPARPRIEYCSLGELATDDVLASADDRLTEAGEAALSRVVAEPTVETFMRASRRFAREADLLTDEVRGVIEDVAAADGEAAMAMLGETVFAVGSGLSDAGYEPAVCRTHPGGATLEEPIA
jgi:pantoate kinase